MTNNIYVGDTLDLALIYHASKCLSSGQLGVDQPDLVSVTKDAAVTVTALQRGVIR